MAGRTVTGVMDRHGDFSENPFSERHDGSAGRTIVGTTGRHRLLKEIESLTNLHDGPSQARRAVTGCVIPVEVGILVKF